MAGFESALGSLEANPQRHPIAHEDSLFRMEVRNLLYGLTSKPTHRAVFEIRGDEVIVHAIRHLSQRDLSPDELK